jgi:phospholipid/cholesterol/gamma-HCH transport system permease protein
MAALQASTTTVDGGISVSIEPADDSRVAERSFASLESELTSLPAGSHVVITGPKDLDIDSLTVASLLRMVRVCHSKALVCSTRELPLSAQRLLELSLSVPERKGARRTVHNDSFFVNVGRGTLFILDTIRDWFAFTGELLVESLNFLRGRARVPVRDIWQTLDQCGPSALPIITLISSLVGVILAFIGAQQLRQFGATIYVANLVGVGMLREMGAVMAAVIMAGRTGAAFAAQLGTMQVNEEIDALKTFGFSPVQYLVIPRVLALVVMMPLLCLYADGLGILGGALVSALTLDISLIQYYHQTVSAVHLTDVWLGVSKSVVFGVLVSLAGCLAGMRCGRSASAVGTAVTTAVVSGIVSIVLADAVFAVITEVLGI